MNTAQLSIDFGNAPAPYQRRSATSRAAAKAIEPRTGTDRARVLAYLRGCGDAGATDEEIQTRLPMAANTERPRRVELKGLIKDSGRTRVTASGQQAVVWVAVR